MGRRRLPRRGHSWRLSLTSGKPRCGHCCTPHTAGCTSCFRPRCSIQGCDKFLEPCNTCQTIPNRPNPPQERIGDKRKAHSTITSFNLHTTGRHFIEKVTEVDHTFLASQVEVGQTPQPRDFKQPYEAGATKPINTARRPF